MKQIKMLKVKTDLTEIAGVNPAHIGVVFEDRVFVNRQTAHIRFLVDLDVLPSWSDGDHREFYLGGVTYVPRQDENGDTYCVSVDWWGGEPDGTCTLTPLRILDVVEGTENRNRPSRRS